MTGNKSIDYVRCPKFEKAFQILGKKWNGLIIDVLLVKGALRFGELKKNLPMISERLLVERLKELTVEGIILKEERAQNSHFFVYCLTEKGAELSQTLKDVEKWAEKWMTLE